MRYNCYQCDVIFTEKNSMPNHKASKYEVLRFDNHQCDGSFTQKVSFTRHKELKHEGVGYKCYQCDGVLLEGQCDQTEGIQT